MKTPFRSITGNMTFTAVVVCLASMMQTVNAAPPKTISVATTEWCPLLCLSNPQKPGVMLEILQKAFPAQDYKIEVRTIEWTKAIEETRAGKHSMIAGGFHSDSPDFFFPNEGQGAIRECFYTPRKSNWFFSDVASLDAVTKMGTGEGYTYDEPLNGWLKANPAKNMATGGDDPFLTNLGKMEKGEIDVLQEADNIVQWHLVNAKTPPDIRQAGCQGKPKEVYFAFSPAIPESQAMAQKLNATTAEMRQSGELKKILAKYNLYDWK